MLSVVYGESVEHIGAEKTKLGTLSGAVLGSWLCRRPAVGTEAGDSATLHLSFLICKVEFKIVPSSQDYCKD